jgi:hypothetical protein
MVGHTCEQQGPNVHTTYYKACLHKRQIIEVFSSSIIPMICTTTNSTTLMNLLDVTHNNALVENFIQLRHWIEIHLLVHGSLCIGFYGYIEK